MVEKAVYQAYDDYQFHHIHQEIHNFCSVDLGGFYLDVIKDRLYCDGSTSKRRASARATLYDIADSLIRLVAPVLPFTAEEAWAFLPNSENRSIHLQTFKTSQETTVNEDAWQHFFAMREQVNTALDQAKKEKLIGSSLAARVTIPDLDPAFAESIGESYEQLLIVAHVEAGESLQVQPADGVKCPRCWSVTTAAAPEHDTHAELCPRCFEVVCEAA